MHASRRRANTIVAFVLTGALVVGSAAAPLPVAAQQAASGSHADVAVVLRSTTLGFGLEISKLITDHFGIRVGGNYFKFSTSATKSDVSYDASLKLHSVTGLIDFFPSARGSFHLTGGVITNPITVSGTGTPDAVGNFTLNGHTYNSAQVGVLTGLAKYPDAGPYVGLGFGTPARKGPLAFFFDLGAMIGQPTVTLTASGAAPGSQLATDLQAQADTTQHDIRKYAKVYPVIGMGVAFRF
ncbi:MAG TPA: hypothetical protein VIE46_10250 [Gemmatimonadales bacterium]|jgi:hypothetical protein